MRNNIPTLGAHEYASSQGNVVKISKIPAIYF